MAAEQKVGWRMTSPFISLVDAVRTRLDGGNSTVSETDERRGENDGLEVEASSGPATGELVSPRERVLQLLARNDGRMKQSAIVSAVEWSESTVSRKLCSLEDAGDVVRYRIGREKLVFLPGAEPDSFESPLERHDENRRLPA